MADVARWSANDSTLLIDTASGIYDALLLIDDVLGGLSAERQFVTKNEMMNVLLDVRGLLTAVPVP